MWIVSSVIFLNAALGVTWLIIILKRRSKGNKRSKDVYPMW